MRTEAIRKQTAPRNVPALASCTFVREPDGWM